MKATQDTFLDCPFSDKDRVKGLGARWHGGRRGWYVPAGQDLRPFLEWLPGGLPLPGFGDEPSDRRADPSAASLFPVTVGVPDGGDGSRGRQPSAKPAPAYRSGGGLWFDGEDGLDSAPSIQGAPADNAPQMTVREFVNGVRAAVMQRFDHDVWIVGQVTSVKERRSMVVIELMDPDQAGTAQAHRLEVKAFSGVWAQISRKLLSETGQALEAGINVRLKIRPEFDPKYHLGARIIDIDPTVTVGAFELRLRRIREGLRREGLFEANRTLPAPTDFFRIAVIHPFGASGLADFKADADVLERLGLCQVIYLQATFEGQAAERSLLAAFSEAGTLHGGESLDGIILIRGGGSKQGLMGLSTEALARAICTAGVPVITGLGHADDDTLLDEVAWKRCDTPSKTIAFVRDTIRARATEGAEAMGRIASLAAAALAERQSSATRLWDSVRHAAELSVQGQRRTADQARAVAIDAGRRAQADFAQRAKEIELMASRVQSLAPALLSATRSTLERLGASVAADATEALTQGQRRLAEERGRVFQTAERRLIEQGHEIRQAIQAAERGAPEILAFQRREITHTAQLTAMMGMDATLARGFALALDGGGRAVTTAEQARGMAVFTLRFRDGEMAVAPTGSGDA